jgi:hypothetical protein
MKARHDHCREEYEGPDLAVLFNAAGADRGLFGEPWLWAPSLCSLAVAGVVQ